MSPSSSSPPPPPVPTLSISGLTLASLLHLASTSPCDASGLLSGHLSLPSLPPALSDFDPPSVPVVTPASLFITHHYSFPSPLSFFSPLAVIDRSFVSSLSPIVGWFSYRRNTSPRPSMRELAVSSSLAKTLETNNNIPCVFLLLSSSNSSNRAVHTHVYKAFVVLKQGERSVLQPVSLKVINVGPSSSGGQYGNFTPELSPLPLMPCSVRATEDLHFNPCSEGEKKKSKKEESLGDLKEKAQGQKTLDSVSDGFGVERLEKLVTGNSYTNELEDLYCSMLSKLEGLVRQVEKSSIRVSDQVRKKKPNFLLQFYYFYMFLCFVSCDYNDKSGVNAINK
ncbi:hypothetical protein LUZ60_015387 [Juncus effusus]|nr:hypothetical protein LUZ60_015387 [Juncus effusus]